MRGDDDQQEGMFNYISPEKRVPADHPLRAIRKMVDEILKEMSPKSQKLYSDMGRPSIAPERLLRSLLLQIFHSVGSECMLIEQLQYNLLFRWFVGMEMGEVKNIDKPVVRAVRLSRLTCPPQDHANNSPLSLWGQRDGFVLSIIRHQRIGKIEPYQSRNQQTPFRIPSQYNLGD